MKDLSLHILDIAQNSVSAGSKFILISINENLIEDKLVIEIEDDGKGMSEEVLAKVTDPYFTSRTTRHVGLGLPLFKQNALMTDGKFHIESTVGKGTKVSAEFTHSHLDRPPMGDMPGVIMMLCASNLTIDFVYSHKVNEKQYIFDTKEINEILEGLPLNDPAVLRELKEMIRENLKDLKI